MPNIIEISDYNDKSLDDYARLTEKQLSQKEYNTESLFIAESLLIIQRALDAGFIPKSFVLEKELISGSASKIISRFQEIPVFTAEHYILEKITGYKLTRGALCAMYRPALQDPAVITKGKSRIAVLENIMNPTNVGAIFRSAAALGIDAVLLSEDCADPLYRRAVRVSMGNVFYVPWTYLPKGESLNLSIHKLGFKTLSMALSEISISIKSGALKEESKLAIILGSEGYGLKADTIENSDYIAKIPMKNNVDSLNVAAAAAVIFWQLGNND